MSILIKGMEMPKDCGHCLLCEQDTIYDALVYRCLVTDNYLDDGYEHQIMKDCPLVLAPKHGRLIDADKLNSSATDYLGNHLVYLVDIDDAPTIIPAEEDES